MTPSLEYDDHYNCAVMTSCAHLVKHCILVACTAVAFAVAVGVAFMP